MSGFLNWLPLIQNLISPTETNYQSFLSTCGDEVYIFTPTVQLGPFCGFDDQFYIVRVKISI